MAGYRIDRVSEDIKREIIAIMRELKDPRIQGMLTVVRVEVSSDLSFAKVYVSAMEGLETARLAVKGLTSATGYVRREVGGRLRQIADPNPVYVHRFPIDQHTPAVRLKNLHDDSDHGCFARSVSPEQAERAPALHA